MKGTFGDETATDWATEPMELKRGLLVARTVLPRRHENLPVRVLNTGDREIYFAKGSEVAEATPVVVEIVTAETPAPESFAHVDPLVEAVDASVTAEEKIVLQATLHEFADVFSKSEYDLGCTGLAKHTIDTGDARPIRQTLRRQPFAHLETIDKQVQDMLKTGIIEPSQSPWVSNVVIVTKKDGSARFCVDYRSINEVTRKDAYPLPRIETCLDALGGARYFSTFDLRSGYHQVKMDEADADKTSFVTRRGTFKFNVLPFGLTNAGATFQRVMDVAMSGLNLSICLIYLDDIILFSSTVTEHLERLRCLFTALRRANLKLKPSKCELLRTKVSFLGHVVSDQGIATDPDKIRAVVEWPVPRSVTEVRSFLGLCSYYRRFVESFATVAGPLHALTGKARSFEWTEECQRVIRRTETPFNERAHTRHARRRGQVYARHGRVVRQHRCGAKPSSRRPRARDRVRVAYVEQTRTKLLCHSQRVTRNSLLHEGFPAIPTRPRIRRADRPRRATVVNAYAHPNRAASAVARYTWRIPILRRPSPRPVAPECRFHVAPTVQTVRRRRRRNRNTAAMHGANRERR